MRVQIIEISHPKLKFKGPDTANREQILEAAILHFIVKLPFDQQPSNGDEIDVSNWIRGELPIKPKKP